MTRRVVLVLSALGLLLPALVGLSAGVAHADRSGQAVRRLAECGTPRLAPALAPTRRPTGLSPADRRTTSQVLSATRRLPARGQAIVLMVQLHADELGALRVGQHLAPAVLAKRLSALRGWQAQPPELVAHRLLGTPDPYAFEGRWQAAVATLAKATGTPRAAIDSAVSTAGRSGKDCRPQGGRALPIPAGSDFTMLEQVAPQVTPAKQATQITQGKQGNTGKRSSQQREGSMLLGTSCGTPVLAATAGTVSINRRDRAAGPWSLTVRQGSTSTTYEHIDQPLLSDGETVKAGQQLATVGSHGWIDRCALGFTLHVGSTTLTRDETATWLMPTPQRESTTRSRHPARPSRKPASSDDPTETAPATTPVRITTFNVLGAHLTGRGSDRPQYADGARRMAIAMGHLNATGSSIAVFQEFESPQAAVVAAAPGWQLHRGTGNSIFRGGNYSGNAIAWRSDTWELVSTSEFSVPWQVRLNMPVVQLRNLQTDAVVVVIGVHNPASTAKQGDQARSRGVARSIEKQYVGSLVRQTGLPVLLAGDMNERDDVICDFAGGGLSTWHQREGGCGSWGYGGVDHVFAAGPVSFDSLHVDRSTLGRVSDHPMVSADVTLNP